MTEHLRVYLDGVFAGDLRQASGGRTSFAYDGDYRARRNATPLSQVMDLRDVIYKPSHVRNWFDGLLPDNPGVRQEWARTYQVSANNPLALLRHVGRDAAGAVQALPAGTESDDAAGRTGDIEWLDDDTFATLLDGLRNRRSDWGREVAHGRWSLAGAQNKVALHHDAAAGRWGVPLDSTPTTHILKASIGGYDLHDVNEFACQRAANRIGLPAARTTLLTHQDQRAVVSERYDRVHHGGRWRRLHQEDFCQALGIEPRFKYQSEGGPGIAQLARVLDRFRGRQTPADARRLFFDYVCFNVIIGGTDAHAKNYSVLHVGGASRLAPLYDLASNLPYLQPQIRSGGLLTELPRSAIKIGDTYDLPLISERDIAKCARTLGLNGDEGVDRYRDTAARAPGAFAEVSLEIADHEQREFVSALAEKIEAHAHGRWREGLLY